MLGLVPNGLCMVDERKRSRRKKSKKTKKDVSEAGERCSKMYLLAEPF
jgi:hypothetical protein